MFLAAFLCVSMLAPLLLKERNVPLSLRSGYAHAGNMHSVQIDRDVVLMEQPRLVLQRGTMLLNQPVKGRVLNEQEINAHLKSGTAQLILDDAKLLIDQTGSTEAQQEWTLTSPALQSILQAASNLSFASLQLVDLKVMANRPGAEAFLVGRLSCEIEKSGDSLRAEGTFTRSGIDLPFDVTLTPNGATDRLPIKVKFSSDLLAADIAGDLVRGKSIGVSASRATVSSPHAKDVLRWLIGHPVSGNGLEEFRISGALDWSDDTFAFQDADVMIDGNEAKGGLSFNLSGPRPMLDGTLAFTNLELAPYIRPLPPTLGLTDSVLSWSRWLVGEPTSASLVRDLDADVRVSAASVTSNGAILGRGAATLTIKDRKLVADLAEIELEEQGQGDARITVDLTGPEPRYEVRGSFADDDLAQATTMATGQAVLHGPGRITVELSAFGNTTEEFRSSLTGTATLDMDAGKLGFDIAKLMASAKPEGPGWASALHGQTPVHALRAKVRAANGLLTVTEVEALTTARRFLTTGTFNMVDQTLDLTMAASAANAAAQSAVETSETVRIQGPLYAPIIRPDVPSKAAADAPGPVLRSSDQPG